MSFIKIRKYKETDGKIINYFDNPNYVDEFYTQNFYVQGIPEYNEELNPKDDFFAFQAGDFSIKISMLLGETTPTGLTVREFIKPQHDFNALFFVWVKLENKDLVGILDVSSIVIDDTTTQNKIIIGFDVFDLRKHFKDAIGSPLRIPAPYQWGFPDFVQRTLLVSKLTGIGYTGSYLSYDYSNLQNKWNAVLGWHPVIIGECWNNILDILEIGGLELDTGFDYFMDLVQQLGFGWKFVMRDSQADPEYFNVILKLFYRNGITDWGELTNIIESREKVLLDSKKYVLMKTTHVVTDTWYGGIHPRYGGAVAGPGGFTFINDCELKPNKLPPAAVMIINAYSDSTHNYRENIYWEGWKTAGISPVAIEDCKIIDPDDDHIFRLDRSDITKDYAWEYYFYNHIKNSSGDYEKINVSIPRLFVKEYSFDEISGNPRKRIIHDDGWDELFQLSIEQYPFLYIGDKTVKEFLIKFELNEIPSIGDTFNFKGYKYFINRISKLNFTKRTLLIDEAIEIGEAA